MATVAQHKLLNGVLIPDLMRGLDIPYSKSNALKVKGAIKTYLRVPSTSALDQETFAIFIQAFIMIAAREFGVEIPLSNAEQSMRQLLKDYNHEL
jgi:hypothetical protein